MIEMLSDPLWCDPVWNQRLHAGLLADGRNPAKRADIETVWAASVKEAKAGWTQGPFTFGQISHRFPDGKRCVRRFGVTQNYVCRPCDDCKGNGINACAQMFERLVCCTPELAADIAAEFSAVFGDFDWKPRFCTDDVEKAYRRLGTATPFLTVVGVTDPRPSSEGGVGVAYFILPGHNFGLKSAPVAFNRAAACMALLKPFAGYLLLSLLRRFLDSGAGICRHLGQAFLEGIHEDEWPSAFGRRSEEYRLPRCQHLSGCGH